MTPRSKRYFARKKAKRIISRSAKEMYAREIIHPIKIEWQKHRHDDFVDSFAYLIHSVYSR